MAVTKEQRLRQRWVVALRSGDYEQARRRLSNGDKFCCLGVLCDLVDPDGWETDADDQFPVFAFDGEQAMAPEWVLFSAGITSETAIWLAQMNDRGRSFDRIADLIEARTS